jgi:hypothetical protein
MNAAVNAAKKMIIKIMEPLIKLLNTQTLSVLF